jgi:hypothetical protein
MSNPNEAWFLQQDDTVSLCDGKGLCFSMALSSFKTLEPTYVRQSLHYYCPTGSHYLTPMGSDRSIIQPKNWEDGNRILSRISEFYRIAKPAIDFELARQKAVIAERRKAAPPQESRKKEYPFPEELIVAMWKHLIDKESIEDSGVKAIQEKRKAVKAKYPTKKPKKSG